MAEVRVYNFCTQIGRIKY